MGIPGQKPDDYKKFVKRIQDEWNDDGILKPEEFVDEFLHDPLTLEPYFINKDEALYTANGLFNNMKLHGLKNLKVKNIKFNIGLMQIDSVLQISQLRLNGFYNLHGRSMKFFRIDGNGNFQMNISMLEIYANAMINKTNNGTIQLANIHLDVFANDINVNFESLGGHKMSSFYNTILNQLSEFLFDHVKSKLLEDIKIDIKNKLNKEIEQKISYDIINPSSAHIFDDILDKAKSAIRKAGLEPFNLPTLSEKFSHDLLLFNFNGVVEAYKGKLSGLTTLIRTGDVFVEYENDTVVLEANLGFENLTGTYLWKAHLMGKGPDGSARLLLSGITSYIKIRQKLTQGSKPIVDEFQIKSIRYLWTEINGLGGWDIVFESIFNLISNAFKTALVNAISGPVKKAVQDEINRSPISFLN